MHEASVDISGDESVAYQNWKEYEKAVEEGKEAVPEEPKVRERPNEKYAFNVDEALDTIDLTFNGYKPSKEALNFFNVIRLVLGEDPEVDNGLMHYFLVDLVFGNVQRQNYPYSPEINERIRLNPRKIAIIASRFSAKALTLDSKVITPSGYTTIKEVAVGDEVLDRDGKRCKVLAKSPIFNKPVYKMTLADGRVIKMSDDHDNIVWKRKRRMVKGENRCKNNCPSGYIETVMTAKELYDSGVKTNRTPRQDGYSDSDYKYWIPMAGQADQEFDYEYKDFGMDPYTVGVILGDGYVDPKTGQPRITYHVKDSYEYIEHIPYEFGKEVRKVLPDGTKTDCYSTCLRHIGAMTKKWIGTKISYDKRVPEQLMYGSYQQRLEVLKGLMDTDGTVYKNGYCSFTSTSKGLAEDVQHLVQSIGGSAFIVEQSTDSEFGKAWSVRIKINKIIFKLKRKVERQTFYEKDFRIPIESIELIDSEPTQCIAVSSPTKSFLTDGHTVTHNSTIITAFMPIYVAVTGHMPNFGDVMFWVSFGDSQQAGAKVQANTIRDICEDSKFCQEYFEKMRFTDEECEFIRKGDGPVKKRCFMFKVKGAAGGSVRGIRYKTERPQIFSFDDIIKNEADANSPVIMAKLKSMIYSDAENATGKKGKIIIVNTPFNKKDPVYAALESGVWTPVCIPICEKIYLDMPKSEYRGSWEAMKSYEDVMEKYEDAFYGDTLREFNQELMLRISSEEDKLIKEDHIQWYNRKTLMKNLGAYNIYVTTDLTASNSTKGDFSCTMAWAVGNNGNYFMLDARVKKMTIAEQYEPVFEMTRTWGGKYGRHVTVGVEIDGQQQLNLHALKKMMVEKNNYFSFARQIGSPFGKEGISRRQATGAKHEQFMRVFPLFQQHKIFFPEELKESPDMKEVLNELNYITYEGIGSKHDDALDCISMLASMDITFPSVEEAEVREVYLTGDGELWAGADLDYEDSEGYGSTVF